MLWDVFISHAHEDKEEVARPLARLLENHGLRVWIDEAELTIGDSLRKKIDDGLANSRFGVVVLSQAFFSKKWPQSELSALWSREEVGSKVILPIWHRIDKTAVASYSPLLADKLAVSSDQGLENIASQLLRALGGSRELTEQNLRERYVDSFDFQPPLIANARTAIATLSSPDTWKHLVSKKDMLNPDIWMGTDSDVLIKVLYDLYAPIAAFRQMSYALRRSLSTFSCASQMRYCLLESAFYILVNEAQLAACGKPITYTPRIPNWRQKRQQEYARYWWQGLTDERFDRARSYFVAKATAGFPDLHNVQTFTQSYMAAYRSCGRNQQDIGLLANALYGFTPKERPVYWRVLAFWDRVYSLYVDLDRGKFENAEELEQLFYGQPLSGFCLGGVPPDALYEDLSSTWDATSGFWGSFIAPRVRSVCSDRE